MSVDAFTVDGKITIDTRQFSSAMTKVTNKLNELSTTFNKPLDTGSFVNGFLPIKTEFENLVNIAKELKSVFRSITDIPKLVEDMAKVKAEIQSIKEKMAQVKTEATGVANEMNKVKEATISFKEALSTVSPNFQSMISGFEMINYQEQQMVGELGKIGSEIIEQGSQIKTNTTYYEEWLNVSKQFENAQQGLIRGYVEQGRAIEEANAL